MAVFQVYFGVYRFPWMFRQKTRVETVEEIKEEETGTSVEETTTTTAEKIVPVTPTHSSVSPVETGKVHPSVNPTEVVIGTDAPGKRK